MLFYRGIEVLSWYFIEAFFSQLRKLRIFNTVMIFAFIS